MIIIIVLEVYHTKKKNLKKLHLFYAYLKKIKKIQQQDSNLSINSYNQSY